MPLPVDDHRRGRELAVSKYAVLPDYLGPGLLAVFVGTAAGDRSATRGHYYAGPGNEFWQFLHQAGLTDQYLGPDRDSEVTRHGLGLTDIAKRRSASKDALLHPSDYDIPAFVAKLERNRPAWVAFHGKRAAREVSRALRLGREVHLGVQGWSVAGASVYVLPSASGSNRDASHLEGKSSRLAWFVAFAEALKTGKALSQPMH
jgi:TDG/mug DNA glycosylase family protein